VYSSGGCSSVRHRDTPLNIGSQELQSGDNDGARQEVAIESGVSTPRGERLRGVVRIEEQQDRSEDEPAASADQRSEGADVEADQHQQQRRLGRGRHAETLAAVVHRYAQSWSGCCRGKARRRAGASGLMRGQAHPVVAATYDAFMLPQELFLGLRKQRVRMLREASGRVLEIAAGTGLNFPYYQRAAEVIAVEPDPNMLRRAKRRATEAPCPVTLVEAGADALPFDDGEFDTVVIAFALCTIPDVEAALREVRRVLRPDGRMVFLEHVRSASPRMAHVQDSLTPLWRKLSGGCNLNRETVEAIEREFDLERVWRKRVLVQGSARPRPRSS
jgi:ubiquinone/menaquinone biosynthesis C-methylase UbiE